MKLGEVVGALPALQKLASEKLTAKALYRVSKTLSRLDKEIGFFNAERCKIVEELGEKVEDKEGAYEIPAANREEFNKRMAELSDIEIDPPIAVIKISTTEDIRLSYNDLRMLEGIVELEDPDEE